MRQLIAVMLLCSAQMAGAQALKNHNSNAPVDVAADRIEVQDRANRAVFAGNVHVVQEGLIMDASRLTVAYASASGGGNPSIQRLDATGGVTVKSADQTARGNNAIYDLNRRIITMLGGVTLVQGGNTVRGGRLVIDLNSGRSVIDGSAAGGATVTGQGGRVTGRFTVPQRTGN
ncbi:Lipopolysaccharide transport periplasmic protein LptA [Sphingomonas antarctica]|uniref:LptA/OstA family protein n=1 Tax=Sphingomonas antarctica TaxID=2040274 RepID=UPI0039ED7314